MRLDLAGGGTDLDAYSHLYGGLAISATIDKYVYVVVSDNAGEPSQVSSSADFINVFRLPANASRHTELPVPRAVLNQFGMSSGCSVFVAMQIPSGSGLGTSTASGIALACGLAGLKHLHMEAEGLAEIVAGLEIDLLKRPAGRQDHYAIAVGGLTATEFNKWGVRVRRLAVSDQDRRELEARLMLFYTGRTQDAAPIWAEQKKGTERNRASVIEALHIIKRQAEELLHHLEEGDVDAIGSCLDATWQAKKNLARNVTDPWIDQWYHTAIEAGASGGKLCGAGGGGFLLLACIRPKQDQVTRALESAGLLRVQFHLENEGASVISRRQGTIQAAPAGWNERWQ